MLHTQATDIIANLNDGDASSLGFSFWFDGNERTDGYSVGNGVAGVQLTPDKLPLQPAYLVAIAGLYQSKGYHGVGGWIDEGILYIDPIHHVVDKDVALFLARQQNELAIYDIAANDCIETGLRK